MAHQEAGEVLLEVAVEASVSFWGPKVSSASACQAATSQSSGSAGGGLRTARGAGAGC